MRQADSLREGERIFTICNACRYCEGFCAVFPAMERRTGFAKADLNYLANLCHNCQECFYACQYAPPHEFAVNVPKTLSRIRAASYEQYAFPGWLRKSASAIGWVGVAAACVAPLPQARGDFYSFIPHEKMVALFGSLGVLVVLALLVGALRFWREDSGRRVTMTAVIQALRDVLKLEYLRSGDAGCTYPDETHSGARRWFHHLTFYGFLLCFASTSVAAFYHYVLGLPAPYDYLSLPVVLGTAGGFGLVAGPAGLWWLRQRQDPKPSNPDSGSLDIEFIVLLLLTSLTGLALLALRDTMLMPRVVSIHLATVVALFLTMPYGKFVHGIYRSLALLRYALERSHS
jgi:citrate/tricarballylate utilization protein